MGVDSHGRPKCPHCNLPGQIYKSVQFAAGEEVIVLVPVTVLLKRKWYSDERHVPSGAIGTLIAVVDKRPGMPCKSWAVQFTFLDAQESVESPSGPSAESTRDSDGGGHKSPSAARTRDGKFICAVTCTLPETLLARRGNDSETLELGDAILVHGRSKHNGLTGVVVKAADECLYGRGDFRVDAVGVSYKLQQLYRRGKCLLGIDRVDTVPVHVVRKISSLEAKILTSKVCIHMDIRYRDMHDDPNVV